jgi:hypothetical protein
VHDAFIGNIGRYFARQLPSNSTGFRFAQNSVAANLHCGLTDIGVLADAAALDLKYSKLRI